MGYGVYVEATRGFHAYRSIRTTMFGTTTYLIFLKLADEREQGEQVVKVPNKYAWAKLEKLDGDAKINKTWEIQFRHTLESLGKQGGMLGLGTIFRKAQNKYMTPSS